MVVGCGPDTHCVVLNSGNGWDVKRGGAVLSIRTLLTGTPDKARE